MRPRTWHLRLALGAILCAGLCGCPARRPDGPGRGVRFESAEALMAAVGDDLRRLTGLRAEGSVDMRRAGERVKARVLYLVDRPGRLRFEIESFFDSPISILVADGGRLELWDMRQGRFYTGRATAENLGRLLPAALPLESLLGVLMGQPPWIAHARAQLAPGAGAGPYELVLENARERQRIRLDPELLRPVEVELFRGAQRVYRLVYEDWEVRGGLAVVPRKILFEMPAEQMHLRIKLTEFEANPTLDPALFRLDPPEGLPRESLDPVE
jgi:hypothetical protein